MLKSSIFKIFTKRILKSEAFISVIIVFVLALGIIGTSYALYMDVDTDTNYQTVKVGDLAISFDNGDNTINLENMTPMEDEYALASTDNIFSFYVYNTGTYDVDYNISLEPDNSNQDELNEILPKYINYQICKDNIENCSEVKTLGDSTDDTIINNPIYRDSLSAKIENDVTNPSSYYFLRIWINNTYNETVGGRIRYKVVVDASNARKRDTLVSALMSSAKTAKLTEDSFRTKLSDPETTVLEQVSKDNERVLATAEDDYGTSYYFRGSVQDNYVEFKNMCFRIVRIEGDGAIKLIYAGSGKCSSTTTTSGNIAEVKFYGYKKPIENVYIADYKGYTGGHELRNTLQTWLNDNFTETEKTKYLKNDKWCLGGSEDYKYNYETGVLIPQGGTYSDGTYFYENNETQKTEEYTYWYYTAGKRLEGIGVEPYTILKCSSEEDYDTNYVGTLTADEVAYAGASIGLSNKTYYLYEQLQNEGWLTLSLSHFDGERINRFDTFDNAFNVDADGSLGSEPVHNASSDSSVRPSVTLVSGTTFSSGDGTKTNPYIIN